MAQSHEKPALHNPSSSFQPIIEMLFAMSMTMDMDGTLQNDSSAKFQLKMVVWTMDPSAGGQTSCMEGNGRKQIHELKAMGIPSSLSFSLYLTRSRLWTVLDKI